MAGEIRFQLPPELGIHKHSTCMSAFCLLGYQVDLIPHLTSAVHYIAIAQAGNLTHPHASQVRGKQHGSVAYAMFVGSDKI